MRDGGNSLTNKPIITNADAVGLNLGLKLRSIQFLTTIAGTCDLTRVNSGLDFPTDVVIATTKSDA